MARKKRMPLADRQTIVDAIAQARNWPIWRADREYDLHSESGYFPGAEGPYELPGDLPQTTGIFRPAATLRSYRITWPNGRYEFVQAYNHETARKRVPGPGSRYTAVRREDPSVSIEQVGEAFLAEILEAQA